MGLKAELQLTILYASIINNILINVNILTGSLELSKTLSHDAIVAIAAVSTITLCISSSALFIVVGVVCIKLKSSTSEHDQPAPGTHTYETIVPMANVPINLEEDSMDKNIAYGPIYAVCK